MNTHYRPTLRALVVLLACSALPAVGEAQPVIAPLPSAAVNTNATGERSDTKSTLASVLPSSLPLLKFGPVAVRPHLLYRILDATGLLTSLQSEAASSVVQTGEVGVLFEIGGRWTLDYTNSRTYYSNHYLPDTIDHDASLTGSYAYDRWSFTVSEHYTNNAPTLVETAQQTPQEVFETDGGATRRIGQHTRLSTTVMFMWRYVHDTSPDPLWTSSDWKTWLVREFVDYELSSRSELGLGVSVGHDTVQASPNMSHAEPQARLTWQPTDKLMAALSGGIEFRKFEGGRGGSIKNLVYDASIRYSVLPTTTLTIIGNRSFAASYFANWATRNSGWSARLDQRLLQRFFLNASYADQETSYVPTTSSVYVNRQDNVRTGSARLSTAFLRHGSISFIYQRTLNSSTAPGFTFGSHQIGAEITYRF